MALVKFNGNYPAYRNLNNLVDGFLQDFPASWGKDANTVNYGFPPVNIHETPEAYHLELSAPGRSKEDFSLSLENNLLTIGFEKKEETSKEEYKTIRKEFSFKSFKRSFNLDENIDASGIQAKYENGVLKLLLPKKEQVKESARQINIQ